MKTMLDGESYVDDTLWTQYEAFCNKYLIIGREPFCGQPFKPTAWQKKWFLEVFCTFWNDGSIKHTRSHVWISKKQGKTTLLASVILFLSGMRRRDQIIVIAQSRDKAKKNIFGTMQEFIADSKELGKLFWDRDSEDYIENLKTGTKIILESGKNDEVSGYNSSLVAFDEIAEIGKFYLGRIYGRFEHAGATRPNAQIITISTANYDRGTKGYSLYCACKKKLEALASGKADPAPHMHAVVYEVPEDADISNPECWWPSLPSTPEVVPRRYYLNAYEAAKDDPVAMADFKCFLLNQWVSSPEMLHAPGVWESCATTRLEKEFYGRDAMIGLDFASHQDLCSWCVTVKDGDKFYCFPRFMMAEATAEQRAKKDGYRYIEYASKPSNNLFFCRGEKTDGAELVRRILDDAKLFKVKTFLYDPYNMKIIRQTLEPKFQAVKEVPQKGRLANAMWHNIDDLIVSRKLQHPNNDVLNFCYHNCKPKREGDSLEWYRASDNARVDGIDATAISLMGWLDIQQQKGPHAGVPLFITF